MSPEPDVRTAFILEVETGSPPCRDLDALVALDRKVESVSRNTMGQGEGDLNAARDSEAAPLAGDPVGPGGAEPAGAGTGAGAGTADGAVRDEGKGRLAEEDPSTAHRSDRSHRRSPTHDNDDDYYGERRSHWRRGPRRHDRSRSPRGRRYDSYSDEESDGGYYRDRGNRRDRRDDRRGGRPHVDRRDNRRHNNRGRRPNVKNISMEDELAQLDRTTRTVQVFNINHKAEERELFQFFRSAGAVADIKIIRDRKSGRSKGFAYVEFEKKEAAVKAMTMSGQELLGQCVIVKSSEAEKNVAWHSQQAAKKAGKPVDVPISGGCIVLRNVHPTLNEDLLKPIFEPFGPVFRVTVDRAKSEGGNLTGAVQFVNTEDALTAVKSLEGEIDISGVVMELEVDTSKATDAPAVPPTNNHGDGDTRDVERLDTDAKDGGGMRLTAQSRVDLMNKLAANAGIEVPKMPDLYLNLQQLTGQTVNDGFDEEVQLTQGVLGPSSPIPTPCLLLKNAFDPDKERAAAAAADEPVDWEREIEDDFRDECSKFGTVVFTHLDPASKGFVYLKFGDTRSATAAQAALHGRWFNMKRLMAEYQFDTLFDAHFGLK